MMRRLEWLALGLFIAGLLGVVGVMMLPTGSTWGVFHEPHLDKKSLRLSETVTYEQTFVTEFSYVSGFLFFIDPPESREGELLVQFRQDNRFEDFIVPLSDVTQAGEVFVPFSPVRVGEGGQVTVQIAARGMPEPLGLLYQIDATKFEDGELFQTSDIDGVRSDKPGDLAFRVRYQSSVMERAHIPLLLVLLGLVGAVVGWYVLVFLSDARLDIFHLRWRRVDTWSVIGLSVVIGGFFLFNFGVVSFDHPSAQGDEMKNLMYLDSTVNSVRSGSLPYWHHVTCGGQPLIGNPEANVFGAGPLFATFFGVGAGMKMLLILEAVVLSVGMYVLARYIGLASIPALWPALIIPLSGYVVNRVLIGHTMYTGGLSFVPWILLTYLMSLRHRYWAVASSALMALAFYRGDTHPLFYATVLMAVWGVVLAVQRRSIRPLVLGVLIGVFFLVLGAPKILPVLESTEHFNSDSLPKMVVLLNRHQLWDDVFLDGSVHTEYLAAELSNAEWEDWENIGSYTGLVVLLLVIPGFYWMPRNMRWMLGVGLVVFLIVGEGAVYNNYLRHVPYLGSLLRLPSRVLIMAIISGTLAGGFALQGLDRMRFGRVVVIVLLLWGVGDVGRYAYQTLGRMEFAPLENVPADVVPLMLQPHPFKPGLHPLTVARRNSVAPGSCQDFNVSPKFTIALGTPLVTTSDGEPLRATLLPNNITINAPASQQIVVRLAESEIMSVSNGYVLPATEDGIPIVVSDVNRPVVVSYFSWSLQAGLIAMITFLVSLGIVERERLFTLVKLGRRAIGKIFRA